eukprot:g33312.t1
MGRLVKMLRRRNGIEAHLAAVIRRVQLGRVMCGLLGPVEQALEHFVLESAAARALRGTGTAEAKLKLKLSALAAKVMARRERRGYRLNLEKFPEGAPLRVRGKKVQRICRFRVARAEVRVFAGLVRKSKSRPFSFFCASQDMRVVSGGEGLGIRRRGGQYNCQRHFYTCRNSLQGGTARCDVGKRIAMPALPL